MRRNVGTAFRRPEPSEAMDSVTDVEQPPRRVEITVDEAMAIAVGFLKESRLADAGLICDKVLELEPDNANALHYAGVIAHRHGDIGRRKRRGRPPLRGSESSHFREEL